PGRERPARRRRGRHRQAAGVAAAGRKDRGERVRAARLPRERGRVVPRLVQARLPGRPARGPDRPGRRRPPRRPRRVAPHARRRAPLAHLDAQLAAGIHGVVMMGSVGENTTLDVGEKRELLKATVAHVGKRVPVLTGVAEYTTAGACRWAADAAKLGADGLMVLPPMVYKSDGRETIAHFRAVAKATDLPIMVYNNPPAYKVDITPEMFVEMADEPKFACIK